EGGDERELLGGPEAELDPDDAENDQRPTREEEGERRVPRGDAEPDRACDREERREAGQPAGEDARLGASRDCVACDLVHGSPSARSVAGWSSRAAGLLTRGALRPAFPAGASGVRGGASPLTAAGPCRTCTGF